MKKIIINSPKYGVKDVLVDDSDYDWLIGYNWNVRKDTHGFYCVSNGKYINKLRQPCIIMHRLIMSASKGKQVDHKNGNGLDNQRENLRFCTPVDAIVAYNKFVSDKFGDFAILI